MDGREDQDDVERVLAGDISAFEPIVNRWQGPLINLAFRFCRDRNRAEDMAQEAFLRVFRGLKNWRRDSAFSTWMFAIAMNFYRTDLRRMPERAMPMESVEALENIAGEHFNPNDGDRDRAVRRAVYALPAKYKEALVLFYFHEMDVAAAAKSLGLPEGTVKARLSRGRNILREKLPQFLEGFRLEEAH